MAIDTLRREWEKMREERKEKFMRHVSDEVQERLADPTPIGLTEYSELRANTYERRLLAKKYDDQAFIAMLENSMKHSQFRELGEFEVVSTYDEAIVREYIPELIRRYKAKVYGEQPPQDHELSV